jgi:seryl-tRNA synthetase
MTAIIENHQTEEGIEIPEPLQNYMGGQEFIELE